MRKTCPQRTPASISGVHQRDLSSNSSRLFRVIPNMVIEFLMRPTFTLTALTETAIKRGILLQGVGHPMPTWQVLPSWIKGRPRYSQLMQLLGVPQTKAPSSLGFKLRPPPRMPGTLVLWYPPNSSTLFRIIARPVHRVSKFAPSLSEGRAAPAGRKPASESWRQSNQKARVLCGPCYGGVPI